MQRAPQRQFNDCNYLRLADLTMNQAVAADTRGTEVATPEWNAVSLWRPFD